MKKNHVTPAQIDFIDLPDDTRTAWWGTFSVAPEQSRYVKIGSVILCIDHYNDEWRITRSQEGEDRSHSQSIAAHIMQGELILNPVLPDRPLIFSLEQSLFLPANNKITLYLSTPVFIRLAVGNPPIDLEDVPTQVLSDTWSGKNTRSGELCYAVPNFASQQLESLQRDNTHAITPVVVQNNSQGNVILKEAKIPSPMLSIFCDTQNHLWTEQVSISIADHGTIDSMILKGPPNGLKNLKQLSSPRFSMKTGLTSLFNVWK